jgi:hypothetical protein
VAKDRITRGLAAENAARRNVEESIFDKKNFLSYFLMKETRTTTSDEKIDDESKILFVCIRVKKKAMVVS